MTRYEYKVCPARSKGIKAAGIKGPEARFAHGLEQLMNEMGADGWEYLRSDILPSEERQGLTSSHTVYRSVLVFRRALDDAMPEEVVAATPDPVEEEPPQPEETDVEPEDEEAETADEDLNSSDPEDTSRTV